ncbi:MAG: Uma2 family endonuclease [Deinococcales bacterium]|nr:Uma2 family endonuclease [Chitinophagaceae bacterium]
MEIKEPAIQYSVMPNAEEYLTWERLQPYKSEYVGGKVIAMAGASPKHNKILSNIVGTIQPYLKGKPCDIYPSDLRVLVKSKDAYFYPDATIVCGELDLSDDFKDTIKNPTIIFEVLSPSTTDYDLGRKFFYYMQIDTLKEYITIDTATLHVRIGNKQENGAWLFKEYNNANDSFTIESIALSISLQDVYSDINL